MEHGIKTLIVAVGSFLSAILGILYVPVLLMVVCNIVDYITGLMAAPNRNDGISSYKSIRGITKKVSMWLLVVVGSVIDQLIVYCSKAFGMDLKINFLVAAVVAIWICCSEILSILENLIDIGITVPKFMIPLVKNIKSQVENQIPVSEDKEGDEK